MQEQKKINIETEYYVYPNDIVFILSDYWRDNTLTVWGFQNERIARQCKTKSDVGLFRIKQQKLNH